MKRLLLACIKGIDSQKTRMAVVSGGAGVLIMIIERVGYIWR